MTTFSDEHSAAHNAVVEQIVASHLQPSGKGWDLPSGSGYLTWLDDTVATERKNYGFPADAAEWAEDCGLPAFAVPYLSQVLDGAQGGHELVLFSGHMPMRLQNPPRHAPRFEDHGEDERLYQESCERFDDETVVKRTSFPILPGETPIRVLQRVAQKHVEPRGALRQACHFSGANTPKPYDDHDWVPRDSMTHEPWHPSYQFALFRRGAVFYAAPVCEDCGRGLASHMEANGERAVFVKWR